METTPCPACQEPLPTEPLPSFCPNCGYSLAGQGARDGWQIAKMDLRKAARYQRRALWLILITAGIELTPFLAPPVMMLPGASIVWLLARVALTIVLIVYVANMLAALGKGIVVRILYIVLLLAPCISIVTLLVANRVAIRALRRAGLHVGLMGVSDEQVVRHLGACRCRQCGYSLIGNTSGRCPECGAPTGGPVSV